MTIDHQRAQLSLLSDIHHYLNLQLPLTSKQRVSALSSSHAPLQHYAMTMLLLITSTTTVHSLYSTTHHLTTLSPHARLQPYTITLLLFTIWAHIYSTLHYLKPPTFSWQHRKVAELSTPLSPLQHYSITSAISHHSPQQSSTAATTTTPSLHLTGDWWWCT